MGFLGFLVKGGMRAGFCSWRPQGPRGSGRPPAIGRRHLCAAQAWRVYAPPRPR